MPRKKRFDFEPANTAKDGHYLVGKGRPPESGKFKKDDGRKRGRRAAGTRNLATDLREELDSPVTVTVGGKAKKVSRQKAILMRLADNATKGQNSAIALALELQQRLVDPVLLREEQRELAKTKLDPDRLTYGEQSVMIYLTGKSAGISGSDDDVIGVIPIYKVGHYLDKRRREAVEIGLKAFGIEIGDKNFFPPECRIVEKKSDKDS